MAEQETGALVVPISEIMVKSDRGRRVFSRIDQMAESLKKHGFINPILCSRIEQGTCECKHTGCTHKYLLIAGERRFRGALYALMDKVAITFRDRLTLEAQKQIELEENVCRSDLSWDEQCEITRQIHEARIVDDPTWTQAKTADRLNLDAGHVSKQISLARKLKANPTLHASVKHLDMRSAAKVIERAEEADKMTRLTAQGSIKITTDLRLGSCLDLIKALPDNSVDMLLTDPPYGVEKLENLRGSSNGTFSGHAIMGRDSNLTLDKILELLRLLAPQLTRVMRPGAHGYVFCAYQYVGDFIKALAPLEYQPPIIHWVKNKSSMPWYGYNYMSHTEAILMFHNPPRGRRLLEACKNLLEHPEVPSSIRRYEFEKPVPLLTQLIKMSSHMGELVLDPFAGSASTMDAARHLGRRSIGFELNPQAWQRAQLYLAGGDNGSLILDERPESTKQTANFGA